MGDVELLAVKMDALHDRMTGIEAAIVKVADAMERIARLEERLAAHNDAMRRAFDAIDRNSQDMTEHFRAADERMKALENAQPVQKLVTGWVLAWIAGAVGLLGGAVAAVVLIK